MVNKNIKRSGKMHKGILYISDGPAYDCVLGSRETLIDIEISCIGEIILINYYITKSDEIVKCINTFKLFLFR